MKCPIDVEKKVAEMRQELHPDALVEDAYRAILGAMNGAYCDGLQGKGYPEDLAKAIADAAYFFCTSACILHRLS